MNINIINKHNYLGEHKGKANILLSVTADDVFSITLEDEQNGTKSSWEMTMYRDDAEKVARHFAEMLGILPVERKGEWIETQRGIHVTDYKCSCCGRTVRDDTGYDVSKDYPFCNCGADMRGDKR
ncbi:MAG: hypothetical protein ILN61_00220 [Lachnospiraceae bacterium]|nr:hypothetical protein [Lachnospiraceae bacterium]